YMTVSKYPDDGVGEVFLKLGKQGSTLAGVMDAFSMAISISLQYGVPLEKRGEKVNKMSIEPDGGTDEPDIRLARQVKECEYRRRVEGLRAPPTGAGPPAVRDAFRSGHPVRGRTGCPARRGRPRRDRRRGHGPG